MPGIPETKQYWIDLLAERRGRNVITILRYLTEYGYVPILRANSKA